MADDLPGFGKSELALAARQGARQEAERQFDEARPRPLRYVRRQ